MKRFIVISASVLFLMSSCQKTPVKSSGHTGILSFDDCTIVLDEEINVKSVRTTDTEVADYTVLAIDPDGNEALRMTYSEILEGTQTVELLAGNYTLVVRSTPENVPAAAFETPVYGAQKPLEVVAGTTTHVGEIVCSLMQCKVTVSYSEEFLSSLTGNGSTKVTLTEGYPLDFQLNSDGTYEQRAGYFDVTGNTLEVIFSGNVNGKFQKMTKIFTGISAKQWRKIHFVPKKNEQGNATFDIVINDLISDEPLNFTADVKETIIGEDPDAPKGDGGIALLPDHDGGCDKEITDLMDIRIVPLEVRQMSIIFKAVVPSSVKKFTVDISTDNSGFAAAVEAADATHLDLINPSEANAIIFTVVPFPHGNDLIGMTEIPFDLSAAQEAILSYKGRHCFKMTIVDSEGCKNVISVVMVVE